MELYNDVLRELRALLPAEPTQRAAYNEALCAPAGEKDRILFGADTAYELGGGGKPGAEAVLFAELSERRSETLVYGPDLCEIESNAPFGHFTVVKLKETENEALSLERLKTVGFTVFQLYPAGYHIRISPAACREQVRVAKAALQTTPPLSLINVGNSLIRAFLQHTGVEYVQTVFITEPSADHKALAAAARRVKTITDAVQSTLQLDEVNCDACQMKPICDEIEGLRELHFRKEGIR